MPPLTLEIYGDASARRLRPRALYRVARLLHKSSNSAMVYRTDDQPGYVYTSGEWPEDFTPCPPHWERGFQPAERAGRVREMNWREVLDLPDGQEFRRNGAGQTYSIRNTSVLYRPTGILFTPGGYGKLPK